MRVAAIDLGTVSSRLALAEVEDGRIVRLQKHTVITDLGRGVDATGSLDVRAIARVVDACRGFVDEIGAFGPCCTCTTLTSAARDASNGEELLDGLRELGLAPQVIAGEVEARLTFYGVAHDFPRERIVVADSGGGSTELALGTYVPGSALELEHVRSLNIGCRRVTDRFLPDAPPTRDQLEEAAAWASNEFAAYWFQAGGLPDRLVAVGGTVTTLVAMVHGLKTYDSSFVHLHDLKLAEVDGAVHRMSELDTAGIAALPGIQPKRAPVILAGAVVIRELMRVGGYDVLTVSENSLLAGMAETLYEVESDEEPAIGWRPRVSR